jgi:hypothetical protein
MAVSTQPICQSLFDFLDGKNSLEKLEAIRSGDLGREINRYVQSQLDQFHIGSIRESFPDSLWGSQPSSVNRPSGSQANPLMFGGNSNGRSPIDLVGQDITRITGPEDLQPGLGGFDEMLNRTSQPTEQIFKSHRN